MKADCFFWFEYAEDIFYDTTPKSEIPDDIVKRHDYYKEALEKYCVGRVSSSKKNYKLDSENELYKEVIEFTLQNSKYVEAVLMAYQTKYTQRELDSAIGFVPKFIYNKKYEISGDSYNVVNKCQTCYCDEINLEIKIPRKFYRIFYDIYGVYSEKYCETTSLVSKKLYDFLIENEIDEKYFWPIYCEKRPEPLAYQLWNANTLPAGTVQLMEGHELCKCPDCGRVHRQRRQIGGPFQNYTVSKEIADKLEPVNFTYEYEGDERKIIVNRQLYELIKQKCPDAAFEPVFLKE